MKDGWLRSAVWILAAVALLALAYPVAWSIQGETGMHLVPTGPFAILFVLGSTVLSIAMFGWAVAIAMLRAARRTDQQKSELEAFD